MGNKCCHIYGNKLPGMLDTIIHMEYNKKKTEKNSEISDLIDFLENNFGKINRVGNYTNKKSSKSLELYKNNYDLNYFYEILNVFQLYYILFKNVNNFKKKRDDILKIQEEMPLKRSKRRMTNTANVRKVDQQYLSNYLKFQNLFLKNSKKILNCDLQSSKTGEEINKEELIILLLSSINEMIFIWKMYDLEKLKKQFLEVFKLTINDCVIYYDKEKLLNKLQKIFSHMPIKLLITFRNDILVIVEKAIMSEKDIVSEKGSEILIGIFSNCLNADQIEEISSILNYFYNNNISVIEKINFEEIEDVEIEEKIFEVLIKKVKEENEILELLYKFLEKSNDAWIDDNNAIFLTENIIEVFYLKKLKKEEKKIFFFNMADKCLKNNKIGLFGFFRYLFINLNMVEDKFLIDEFSEVIIDYLKSDKILKKHSFFDKIFIEMIFELISKNSNYMEILNQLLILKLKNSKDFELNYEECYVLICKKISKVEFLDSKNENYENFEDYLNMIKLSKNMYLWVYQNNNKIEAYKKLLINLLNKAKNISDILFISLLLFFYVKHYYNKKIEKSLNKFDQFFKIEEYTKAIGLLEKKNENEIKRKEILIFNNLVKKDQQNNSYFKNSKQDIENLIETLSENIKRNISFELKSERIGNFSKSNNTSYVESKVYIDELSSTGESFFNKKYLDLQDTNIKKEIEMIERRKDIFKI